MYQYDELFPEYGFKSHKGYGTKEHYEAIEKYGITHIHEIFPSMFKVVPVIGAANIGASIFFPNNSIVVSGLETLCITLMMPFY